MNYKITLAGQKQPICLQPKLFQDKRERIYEVNGKTYVLFFEGKEKRLYLWINAHAPHEPKCFKVMHFAHAQIDKTEFGHRVKMSSSLGFIQASIDCDVPGMDQRAFAKKLKGITLHAPMTGKVLAVHVKNGEPVAEGATVCVIEAMKMENKIIAETSGIIGQLKIVAGESISVGTEILTIKPE